MVETTKLSPVSPNVPNERWIRLDEEEKERIQTLRNIICNFNGVFRFTDDNMMLFCTVCQYQLPYNSIETVVEDVNNHVATPAHMISLNSYIRSECDDLNKVLATAISDGIFHQMCDGLVRCLVCGKVLNDSLANLKRHLFTEQHKFGNAGLPHDQNAYANPYGQAARKLFSLVKSMTELEFTTTEKGHLKVKCNKCSQLMRREYNDVRRHLKSKKHTNEKRKKRSPNKKKVTDDEAENDDSDALISEHEHVDLETQPKKPKRTRRTKSKSKSKSAAITTTIDPAEESNDDEIILVQSGPSTSASAAEQQYQPIYVIQGSGALEFTEQQVDSSQQATWNSAFITSLDDLVETV